MLFPTTSFAIFFAVVFTAHWLLCRHRTRWRIFMAAASYFFYGWWDWRLVWLLAAATVISQLAALAVAATEGERRRWAMIAGVAGNLGLLCFFKYYGFFAVNLDNGLHGVGLGSAIPLLQLTLPVGISFYTFMGISYVVDVYRRDARPAPWLDFIVYLSFFPHLIAGPIVRANELIPQIQRRPDPRSIDVAGAAYLIWGGLFKKVVLSSFLASAIVDPVFGAPTSHSSLEILVAVYAYAAQIYADFSGYTDIAIGVALLLGFRLPQNFNAPYTAASLRDFWRRWHMTLSRWLRDYLYIPLGGSKGTGAETYRNLLITMALGGLWHGAAWTFVAWGVLHGVGLCVGRWRQAREAQMAVALGSAYVPPTPHPVLARVATFHFVCLGWLLFRADSLHTAWTMLVRLFTAWGPSPAVTPLVLAAIALGIGVQYVPKDVPERVKLVFSRAGATAQGVLLGVLLFVISALGPQGVAPFIYFRF
jgi:alginate O-acetyltransferase complex protein AlgI